MVNNFQQIKIEQLNSISVGDNEFKKELIEIFISQIPEFISNMKKFYGTGDLINLEKEAHTAKLLEDIQLQSENNTTEQLSSIIERVELELNDAVRQLHVILDEL